MPRPDPVSPLGPGFRRRYVRALKVGAAFSAVIAGIAVLLVNEGNELHIHMLIATALGVGLSMFLGIALMTLVFISNSSGHDAEAADHHIKDEQ